MIVIVYGYDGSGPGHWQRWLEAELRRQAVPVLFPELPDPLQPQKDVWVAGLADVVARSQGAPVTFVCHSLGCWALDHFLAEHGARGIHAGLLVAPPSPYLLFEPVDSFLPPPRSRAAWAPLAGRSLLVGSDNDDFTSADELREIADSIGIGCQVIPGAGHVNTAAGYGPWPFVLEWLAGVGALDR